MRSPGVIDLLERHGAAFVSVSQPIDTTSSIGKLLQSILMGFAQFERDTISERTRDKLAAARRKGKWTGGHPMLGYDIDKEQRRLAVREPSS